VEKTFEKIYREHFTDVYKYVLSLCQNDKLAEEITQETFFKAMQSIDQFNGTCKLYVWLCQIAKNTYFQYSKRQKRHTVEVKTDLPSEIDIEADYLDKDMSKQLHRLLHQLNDPYKEVFTLRVFCELPFSQIGELFNKSESWARLIFFRAKKKLQEGLK